MDRPRSFLIERLPKNSYGAEIGVWKGEFAKSLVSSLKPKMLYLIDPWVFINEYPDRWYGGSSAKQQEDMDLIYSNVDDMFSNNKNVKILKILSEEIPNYIKPDSLDWTYIDGNHSYEFVLKDLNMSFDIVKEGGLITGDDLAPNNGVERAIKDFFKEKGNKISLEFAQARQFIIKINKKYG